MGRDGKILMEIAMRERLNVSREQGRQLITCGAGAPRGWPGDANDVPQVPGVNAARLTTLRPFLAWN